MDSKLIYDVGMHNGDDTAYYLHRGYRVVAIEAIPDLAARAGERFQEEIEEGRLVILNVAIAENEGLLPFYVCETMSQWSSFDIESAGRDGAPIRQIDVKATPFRTVLAAHGVPYYLKIDIEGADALCIQDLNSQDAPQYISIEKPEQVENLLSALASLGYQEFKCISQFNYLPVEMRPDDKTGASMAHAARWKKVSQLLGPAAMNSLSEALGRTGIKRLLRRGYMGHGNARTREDWQFPIGSSGPFGEETIGVWQSYDQMLETLTYFDAKFKAGEPSIFWNEAAYSFWADIHARRSAA